jgi:S-DNA-T family DNA segregation ATPase FtsK/SpoIIIE
MTRKRAGYSQSQSTSLEALPERLSEWWWSFVDRAWDYVEDFGALALGAAVVVTVLGMLGLTDGSLVDSWVRLLFRWLGWGGVAVPAVMFAAFVLMLRRSFGRTTRIHWIRVIAVEFALFAFLGVLASLDGMSLARAEAGAGGGLIGWGLATLMTDMLGGIGGVVALALVTVAAGVFGLGPALGRMIPDDRRTTIMDESYAAEALAEEAPVAVVARPEPGTADTQLQASRHIPRAFRKNFRVEPQRADKKAARGMRSDRLPPVEILERGETAQVTAREINQAAGLIEKTLADFGLPATVVSFRSGPAVTQFAVEPGFIEHTGSDESVKRQKVRVSQISALANDLALALSAPTLRIEAPVPGHAYVGIEVPNRKAAHVRLRPVLESEVFQSAGSPLAIALGRDVAGAPVVADLAAMPHLLIAGTTGSGKSVCITSLTACLVMNNSPEDLRLVMIDPKMVELVRFNGLPHLLGRVETGLERIVGVLRWCTQEMDRRYKLLEQAKARDIEAYNRRVRRRKSGELLPRIVVMIDELADLMMMAPDQTERTVVRLAQMARATGLHLVLATQRPSTDIVTGLIKANFPARISFAVASSVDSRVILDAPGAETLLGRGDMLYLAPEAGVPTRLQGVYVSDLEIERMVAYWQSEQPAEESEEVEEPPWEELLARQAVLDEQDDVLEQAIALVKETGQASASLLQRRLRVGYPRAARLMDELEELGIVGRRQAGGRTREILIGEDDDPSETGDE